MTNGRVPAFAAFALVLSITSARANPLFGIKTDFTTGSTPTSVSVGDLNGDGKQDLAVASQYGGMNVLFGDGLGGHSAYSSVGGGGYCAAFGDFNGDGWKDLVVGTGGSAYVLRNLGGGSLSATAGFGTGTGNRGIAVADFNGDGKQDVAIANYTSSDVSVLMGNGDATFAPRTDYATGSGAYDVEIADFNSDGKLDLVVANYGANTISVLLGNGAGGFGTKTDFASGTGPISLAIADFNGDGKKDVVTANSGASSVSVLLGNGSGGFGAKSDFTTGTGAYGVAAGDLNADGLPDVAVTNVSATSVSTLLGNGDGTLASRTDYLVGSAPVAVAIADVSSDGRPDLVVVNQGSNTVSVLLAQGVTSTTTALVASPNPAYVGQSVQLTATVSPAGATGYITFHDGATQLGVLAMSGSQATLTVPSFANGNHNLQAFYSGDASHDVSHSGTVVLGVFPAPGTIALTASPNPSHTGENVLLTATITPSGATGPVEFRDGALSLGTGTLSGGVATLVSSFPTHGAHDLTAVYAGNSDVSGCVSAVHVQQVDRYPTTVGMGSNPNPSVAGQPVQLTAVVYPSAATGSVTFFDGITALGTSPLVSGQAQLNLPGFTGGAHTLTATYLGDAMFEPSTSSSLSQGVVAAPGTVVLASAPNPSHPGASVLLIATISPAGATGSVEFREGATVLGTGTLVAGVATLTLSTLPLGGHALTASYAGNSEVAACASIPLVHNVAPFATTLSLTSDPNPSAAMQPVLLTAHVTPADATGSVSFYDGATSLGTAPLGTGHATLLAPGFTAGSHVLVATYSGDTTHEGCASVAVTQAVNATPTSVSVATSPNPSHAGEAVSVVATVTDPGGTPGSITGSVKFTLDGLDVSPVALSGNTATWPGLVGLSIGTHTFTATYLGDANYSASTSTPLSHVVLTQAPTIVGVRDVINDQGGRVKLLWTASPLDLAPSYSIESYWVLRSTPSALATAAIREGASVTEFATTGIEPHVGGFVTLETAGTNYYWEFLASQPAFHVPDYSYVAATTCDSIAGSNPFTAFMIMARTAGGAQWWFSNVDSGYSVDNLAPRTPAAFAGTRAAGAATLHWHPNPEVDLQQYELHRGASANFVPGPASLVATPTDTSFVDATGIASYYKLRAVDVHGNASGFATLLLPATTGVPEGDGVAFGLERVRPNPSRGDRVTVTFSLPSAAPARIELVDVSGRRIVTLPVGALGPGRHTVPLHDTGRLAPGLYLVRLKQGTDERVTRTVVLP